MVQNKVVLKFKSGAIIKGSTADFLPGKATFHLILGNSEVKEINPEILKAIFFVKDFEGNKSYTEQYKDSVAGGGRKIQVKFSDGEVITGFTQGYAANRPGFFMVPADKQSNNDRIYIVRSATQKVEFI